VLNSPLISDISMWRIQLTFGSSMSCGYVVRTCVCTSFVFCRRVYKNVQASWVTDTYER